MFSIENLSICSSCFFLVFFFVHYREAIHGFEFFLHYFFFNFLASTFPQLASCCFEFFLHFFSYDFSFIFCIHLSPTVILFNKEKLSMISSFSFNFFLSSFFCIYLSPTGLLLNIGKLSMKWHESQNDMKRQMTWNAKWHETPNDMKRQMTWNA